MMFASQMQIERIRRLSNDAHRRRGVARRLVYRRICVGPGNHAERNDGFVVNNTTRTNSHRNGNRRVRLFRTITEWQNADSTAPSERWSPLAGTENNKE